MLFRRDVESGKMCYRGYLVITEGGLIAQRVFHAPLNYMRLVSHAAGHNFTTHPRKMREKEEILNFASKFKKNFDSF